MPLTPKILYTAWMCVWVPVYWALHGWSNFLWLCDFANLVTLAALWSESGLLASSQLSGVLFIQVLWASDWLGRIFTGSHPIGGTEYMFDSASPLWLRAISLFHLWTVPFLAWMVHRLGHDRRGWRLEALFATLLFPLGQTIGTREQNLNWTWYPFGVEQTWLPPLAFAFVSASIVSVLLFWPADLLVRRWLGATPTDGTEAGVRRRSERDPRSLAEGSDD